MITRLDLPPVPIVREPRPAHDEAPNDRFARLLEDRQPTWRGPGSQDPEATSSGNPPLPPEAVPVDIATAPLPPPSPSPTVEAHGDAIAQAIVVPTASTHTHTQSTSEFELVSLPWQLRANAGLSYRSVDAHAGPAASPAASGLSCAPAASTNAGAAAAWPLPFAWQSPADAMLRPIAQAQNAQQRAGGVQRATASAPASASAASALSWPERMLRWLADADARTTVWIRDYALDADGAKALLQAVRDEAAERGVVLGRVMLNGHELWRSTDQTD